MNHNSSIFAITRSHNDMSPAWQCPRGTAAAVPCLAGRFSSSNSLTSAEECEVCTVGGWCSVGAKRVENCLAGYFGDEPGQTDPRCSGSCEVGYYCPTGSTSATQEACRKSPTELNHKCSESSFVAITQCAHVASQLRGGSTTEAAV